MATPTQYLEILDTEMAIDMAKLVDCAKHGIPDKMRGEVWKYLLEVSKPDKAEEMKQARKQLQEYQEIDKTNPGDILKTIRTQLKRYNSKPQQDFFQQEAVQTRIQNILTAFSNYNSADVTSSTVTLLCPFVYTLKNEFEAFWCFEAFMKKLESNISKDTLSEKVGRFIMYFRSTCPQLFDHFEEEEVSPNEWATSWLQNLLSRELPLDCVLRLWDTYLSCAEGFDLHLYVCLAILVNCSDELMELEVLELKAFLQRLPGMDMDEIISQAYNIKSEIVAKGI